MLVSFAWLRSLCPVEEDVRRVADALTARGLTVDSVEPAGDDHTLDIDVPANRPDCLGHVGLARELSAAFGVPLSIPDAPPAGEGEPVDRQVQVAIEDPELCSRYTAGLVRGVRVGPSPPWVVRRLEACGLRSVSNVVDASNLVMLETGNPIHFFDLSRIAEATIGVRRARAGEKLTTLDGEPRQLDEEMLLITDGRGPVALAGIMGGADSEIGAATRDVLIEAASFAALAVRATSRKLGLQTDAGQRFGRGVDPESVAAAQSLAARLLVELAAGTPAPGIIDVHPRPCRPRKLVLRLDQLQRLLGYRPGVAEVRRALAALLLAPEKLDAKRFEITVPSWRVDLEREADLVEEVARHLGYDRVPAEATGMPTLGMVPDGGGREERARDLLAHGGFCEAVGYAMIGDGEDAPYVDHDAAPSVALTNPIADWLARLRRSILPGLVRAADLNHRRGVRDVRLFEIGRVFQASGEGAFPHEPLRVGLVWSGAARPLHWDGRNRDADLFDMMGIVESLLGRLAPTIPLVPRPGAFEGFHPGRSVTWTAGAGDRLAWCGALHPDLQCALAHPLLLAEVELDRLDSGAIPIAQYSALPRLTAVSRDISLVLRPEVSYSNVLEVVTAIEAPAAVSLQVADRYEGPPLEPGELSLTIRMVLQPSEKTLTDAEIDGYRLALIDGLKKSLGLRIRD